MATSDKTDSANQVIHIHYVHHIHHYPGVAQYPGMPGSMPGYPHADVMVAPGFHAPKAPEKPNK
jgi:hypothetical protein